MGIALDHVFFTYGKRKQAFLALDDLSLTIPIGVTTALIGATGSGKTTLIQLLNGLFKPSSGTVEVLDYIFTKKAKYKKLSLLRRKVGLLFQFSENQLFEDSIIKDVMFGPLNFKYKKDVARKMAEDALKIVGLDESYYDRSPFTLSGGEKRRVALAGVLAIEPEIIILDEPTSSLDLEGQKMIRELLSTFKNLGKTVIVVTHDYKLVLASCDEVIKLQHGKLAFQCRKDKFFTLLDEQELPDYYKLKRLLTKKEINLPYQELSSNEIITVMRKAKHE
ncbi:MAG: ATP-binding cassette domain-containing protein [Erysipelotrichaceae bacterium]|jgi:energy-coupling factor transport system ATP-binding protein|nr:ATP-binding cassette domain-containing protein [Erysipelotrichaceae bacterium]